MCVALSIKMPGSLCFINITVDGSAFVVGVEVIASMVVDCS